MKRLSKLIKAIKKFFSTRKRLLELCQALQKQNSDLRGEKQGVYTTVFTIVRPFDENNIEVLESIAQTVESGAFLSFMNREYILAIKELQKATQQEEVWKGLGYLKAIDDIPLKLKSLAATYILVKSRGKE